MPATTATRVVNVACCQPDAVSPMKVVDSVMGPVRPEIDTRAELEGFGLDPAGEVTWSEGTVRGPRQLPMLFGKAG